MKVFVGLILVCALAYSKTIAYPLFQGNEDGTVSAFVDVDDYDNVEDLFSPMQSKRFWLPHPSDYNPLRRPVPPRGSKRDNVVYHPVPRVVTIKQRSSGPGSPGIEEYPEEVFEASRQKKQTRPTTLIFRLGSWGLRGGKKNEKGSAGTPSPGSA